MSSESESSRRGFLKGLAGAATAGTIGLSGCLTLPPEPGSGPAGGPEPTQRPQTGTRTDGAFLYESFEQGDEYNIISVPGGVGEYVPTNNNAIQIDDQFARTGTRSFRLHVDYEWSYPSNIRRGTNKPIPDNRGLMQEQGYSTWEEPIWFAFSLGLPQNWQPDSIVEQVQEFHRDLSENPGGSNGARKDYSGSRSGKPVTTRIDGRTLEIRNDWMADGEEHNQITAAPVTLQAGNWYDVVINAKWTNENNGDGEGFLRVWVNDHLVVDHQGNTVANDVAPPRPPELRIYKWRWDDSSVTPDQRTRTYFFDEIRYGWSHATYEDMVPGSRGNIESRYPEWWTF